MKPSYVLLNVVLIAGGLFLYHSIVGGPAQAPSADPYAHLEGDDYAEPHEDPTVVMLDGGADEALSRRNAQSIMDLQRELALLRARRAKGSSEGSDAPFARGGGELPTLNDLDQVDEDNPQYDERSLASLELMIDEINRRKAEARNKTRLEGELTRLGVDLDETQRQAVVDATLDYQKKARSMLSQGWPKDDAGRAARKEAFGKLREDFAVTINTLVPAAEAEKITSSRITRSYGSAFGGGRRDKGRTRNRNRK